MPEYSRAYLLKQLREFSGWKEKTTGALAEGTEARTPDGPATTEPQGLTDDSVVFLREDLTVSTSGVDPSDIIFDAVTPAWESFCRNVLHFAVPDWEKEAAHVREKIASLKSKEEEKEAGDQQPVSE